MLATGFLQGTPQELSSITATVFIRAVKYFWKGLCNSTRDMWKVKPDSDLIWINFNVEQMQEFKQR